MKKRALLLLSSLLATTNVSASDELLQKAIDGEHRQDKHVHRDQYRNPLKTLQLFDIQSHHTVVEVWPGGGWYTEILAPYLKSRGQLIAAHFDAGDTQASYRPNSRAGFEKKMNENPEIYSKVKVASLMFDEKADILVKGAAQSNSVDRVVTFRNAHGMVRTGVIDAAFEHFFDVLKSGGKFGVVQHQADENQDWRSRNIGYVSRAHIIAVATKAGFVLEAEGYFNNNPLDSKRHEKGVWQLPPALRGVKTDQEKAAYLAIGESNRMTLVFSKP